MKKPRTKTVENILDETLDSTTMDLSGMEEMMKVMGSMFEGAKPMVKFIKRHANAELPKYQSEQASGFDIHTPIDFDIKTNECKVIDSGLQMADITPGYEIQVRPRSGLAAKSMITVLNTPGTVDNDYRGNILVILMNFGPMKSFKTGDRICQCVFQRFEQCEISFTTEEEMVKTKRGDGALASTDKKKDEEKKS